MFCRFGTSLCRMDGCRCAFDLPWHQCLFEFVQTDPSRTKWEGCTTANSYETWFPLLPFLPAEFSVAGLLLLSFYSLIYSRPITVQLVMFAFSVEITIVRLLQLALDTSIIVILLLQLWIFGLWCLSAWTGIGIWYFWHCPSLERQRFGSLWCHTLRLWVSVFGQDFSKFNSGHKIFWV
jgi:hypothetical protein